MTWGTVVGPGEGEEFTVGLSTVHVKAGGHNGHKLVGVFQSTMQPGGGFPIAHVHDVYEEVFHVLQGTIEYRLGDEWHEAVAGTTISVPPGVVHCFRNTSGAVASHLVVHAPIEALEAIEAIARAPREEMPAIMARYKTRLVD
jgi:uncharacterized cupin superfamily protein